MRLGVLLPLGFPSLGLLSLGLLSLGLFACPPSTEVRSEDESDITWAWTVEPDPPVTGPVLVLLTLTERATGDPVTEARIRVEATMSHPGMTPIFATARETDSGANGPGTYEVSLDLGMAGDWILLLDAELSGGRTVHRRIDLPGVGDSGS